MRIIGIDPGLSGAIAILDDLKIFDMFDMPIMAEGKKNKNPLKFLCNEISSRFFVPIILGKMVSMG